MPYQVYTISNPPPSTYSHFRIPSWKDPTIPFCNTFDLISQPSPYLTPKKLNTSRALRCQSRKIHHAKTVPVTTCSSLSLLADYETPFLHSCVWLTRVIYMCVRCLLLILHSSTRTGPDTLHSSWKINTAFHTSFYRIPAIASHRTDPSRDTLLFDLRVWLMRHDKLPHLTILVCGCPFALPTMNWNIAACRSVSNISCFSMTI